ncbi:nucleolar and spindle-associated protein 1 [Hippoglossus hippoglossus]|uniref:nucleolar and spindle-associated protein 1 n=1 Tax=Hippoglossus hippoglossus TaxID=8267 RepID=UPI00148DB57B|nr:nucleolar and spindle-associated protein 1 [Hippoglossus hippoglossus]
MDLDAMKYAELRNVAKELGLKGNMKADKLLKLIKQHYQKEKNEEEEEEEQGQGPAAAAVEEDVNAGQGAAQESEDATSQEEVSSTAAFVNTRRGRGNGTKRKVSDTEAECDVSPPTAAEGDVEVAASAAPRGARRSKKRKVSSVKDSDQTEPQKESQVPESEQQLSDAADEAPGTEKATKVAKAGKIPRYQGLQQKKQLKPVTPNFKKLHEAHFNKMESIDSYMQRKTKQMDTYRASVKELKNLSDKTKLQQADGKTRAKANQSRTSILSPAPVNKRTADGRRTLLSASKAPPKEAAGKEDAPFRPSVLSTRRINVRFTEATKDNEFKRSLVKTPARKSACVTSSTPQIQTTGEVKSINVKTTTFSAANTPGAFIFTGNTSTAETPGTQKKQSFDLKASLSRPLSYKPHTGKLKAFEDVKENTTTAADKSLISNSHQTNYKKHQVQTRDNRREKHTADRKQKKESVLGARRGLVMM